MSTAAARKLPDPDVVVRAARYLQEAAAGLSRAETLLAASRAMYEAASALFRRALRGEAVEVPVAPADEHARPRHRWGGLLSAPEGSLPERILTYLRQQAAPVRPADVAEALNIKPSSVRATLVALRQQNLARTLRRGAWEAGSASPQPGASP